jgi:hypothetical protein
VHVEQRKVLDLRCLAVCRALLERVNGVNCHLFSRQYFTLTSFYIQYRQSQVRTR